MPEHTCFLWGLAFDYELKKKGESRIRRNWDALLHRNPKEQLNFLENSKKRFYPSWIRLTGRTILMLPKKKFEKLLKDPSARSKLESLHAARSFKFGSALSEPCYTNYARLNSTVPIVMSKLNMSNFFRGRWPEVDFLWTPHFDTGKWTPPATGCPTID